MKINEAMLCWNEKTKEVKLVKYPDLNFESRGYSSVGAQFSKFNKMSLEKKKLAILSESIWIIKNRGIPFDSVFSALMQIDELYECITKDPFTV